MGSKSNYYFFFRDNSYYRFKNNLLIKSRLKLKF
ncbi:hemopexin repeat-containing protein [Enterobacter cloacae complex sp. 2DZ2F20B]|nr:hypothetical protein DD592_26620 [Enterobacter cloacae complex sp. 2DZ2F20B]